MIVHQRPVKEIVAEIRSETGGSVNQQLAALISMFCDAARAIDPTITDIWVGKDGPDLLRPYGIRIDRDSRQ